jgi:hypothetical protein
MITAAAVYKVLTSLSAWVQLRDVCVFTGPFFAGNTVSGSGLQDWHLQWRMRRWCSSYP